MGVRFCVIYRHRLVLANLENSSGEARERGSRRQALTRHFCITVDTVSLRLWLVKLEKLPTVFCGICRDRQMTASLAS